MKFGPKHLYVTVSRRRLQDGEGQAGRPRGYHIIRPFHILAEKPFPPSFLPPMSKPCLHTYTHTLHYIQDPAGMMAETDPLCLMDFYVHDSMQRKGLGADFFKQALQVRGSGTVFER